MDYSVYTARLAKLGYDGYEAIVLEAEQNADDTMGERYGRVPGLGYNEDIRDEWCDVAYASLELLRDMR